MNIAKVDNDLPTIEDLVPMAMVVNHKVLHEFILLKYKEQTTSFTKRFKRWGNFPQINTLRQELTRLVNQGGDNSDKILRLQNQIQLLVDKDLTKAIQNKKNFRILEDEMPSTSFLNLGNSKIGYEEVMLIKKENWKRWNRKIHRNNKRPKDKRHIPQSIPENLC